MLAQITRGLGKRSHGTGIELFTEQSTNCSYLKQERVSQLVRALGLLLEEAPPAAEHPCFDMFWPSSFPSLSSNDFHFVLHLSFASLELSFLSKSTPQPPRTTSLDCLSFLRPSTLGPLHIISLLRLDFLKDSALQPSYSIAFFLFNFFGDFHHLTFIHVHPPDTAKFLDTETCISLLSLCKSYLD